MTPRWIALGLAATTALSSATPGFAQSRVSGAQRQQQAAMAQIPHCPRPIGSLSIVDGQASRWRELQLAPSQTLLRVVVQRSNCFTLVDRGAGMEAAMRERDLAGGGQLQRGSNVGGGQVRAADYVLVAEIANQNANSGGSAVAGIAGAMIGGTAGAIVGGLRSRRSEANTVLSLTNVRTSETVATTQGYATKNDIGFAVGGATGGSTGFGGAVGGGYENTEIGQVVTQAFINAYSDLVTQLGGLGDRPAQEAPSRSFTVTTATTLRRTANPRGAVVRALPVGLVVYPTGNRDGMWWEVADDNDNVGWVMNDKLAAAQ